MSRLSKAETLTLICYSVGLPWPSPAVWGAAAVLWERQYTHNIVEPKTGQWPAGLAVSETTGQLFVGVTEFRATEGGVNCEFLIWELDESGTKVREFSIHQSRQRVPIGMPGRGPCLLSLPDGQLLWLAYLDHGIPSILRISSDGTLLDNTSLAGNDRNRSRYNNMFPVEDNQLMVLGSRRGRASLMKIDESGQVLWEKSPDVDLGPNTSFRSGAWLKPDYVVSGLSFSEEEPRHWVLKLDKEGTVLQTHSFMESPRLPVPGSELVKLNTGNIALLCPATTGEKDTCRVRILDTSLDHLADRSIATTPTSLMGAFRANSSVTGAVVCWNRGFDSASGGFKSTLYQLDDLGNVVNHIDYRGFQRNPMSMWQVVKEKKAYVLVGGEKSGEGSVSEIRMVAFDLDAN